MNDVILTATKEFSWDMAHMLAEHEGLCKNIHGHTYKMEVTVRHIPPRKVEISGASRGMIVDFKELKGIVKDHVVDPLDHAFVSWLNTSDLCELDITRIMQEYGKKVVCVQFRPTAENMAYYFVEVINQVLIEQKANYRVVKLKLWETPTSYCEVEATEPFPFE